MSENLEEYLKEFTEQEDVEIKLKELNEQFIFSSIEQLKLRIEEEHITQANLLISNLKGTSESLALLLSGKSKFLEKVINLKNEQQIQHMQKLEENLERKREELKKEEAGIYEQCEERKKEADEYFERKKKEIEEYVNKKKLEVAQMNEELSKKFQVKEAQIRKKDLESQENLKKSLQTYEDTLKLREENLKLSEENRNKLKEIGRREKILDEREKSAEIRMKNMQGKVDDQEKVNEDQKMKIKDLNQQIKGLNDKIQSQAINIRQLKKELQFFKNQKTLVLEELKTTKSTSFKIFSLMKKMNQNNELGNATVIEKHNLREQIMKIQNVLKQKSQECLRLRSMNQELEKKVKDKDVDLKKKVKTIAKLKNQIFEMTISNTGK